MTIANPEIGRSVTTGAIRTNYHDVGTGEPVLLLHGSGPGVNAFANWRLTMRDLAPHFRVLAPDLADFRYTEVPDRVSFTPASWLGHVVSFLDAVRVDKVNVIGNSFGGSMALALAIHHPERVDRMVLMGSVGVTFELTDGLDAVWGYEPSVANMRSVMKIFAYDQSLVGDELVRLRYAASARPGVHEAYSSMFPAPRQRWVDAMTHAERDIRKVGHRTLLLHGRDDKVIPLSTSLTMQEWIDRSQLHIYGRCGHWTQIEHAQAFAGLVTSFLSDSSDGKQEKSGKGSS